MRLLSLSLMPLVTKSATTISPSICSVRWDAMWRGLVQALRRLLALTANFVLPLGLLREPLLLMENMENADKVWQYDYR